MPQFILSELFHFLHLYISPVFIPDSNDSYSHRTPCCIVDLPLPTLDIVQVGHANLPRPTPILRSPWMCIGLGATVQFYWTWFLTGPIFLLIYRCSWSIPQLIMLCPTVHHGLFWFYWCIHSLTFPLLSLDSPTFQLVFFWWTPSPRLRSWRAINNQLLWRWNPLWLEQLWSIHHAPRSWLCVVLPMFLAPWYHPKRQLGNIQDGLES